MLRRLGFGDELLRLGARWVDPQFLRADGSYAASMWPAELDAEIEFYGMHRADLLGMLAARLPPRVITADHKCVGFEQEDTHAVLSFANGSRTAAHVVIAADGIHSRLQQFVVAPSAPISSGCVAYRGIVRAQSLSWPAGAMRNWLGAGRHFLAYPMRRRTRQLRWLCADRRGDERVMVRAGRSARVRARICSLRSGGRIDYCAHHTHLP